MVVKRHEAIAMASNSEDFCIYEEELRDLLTYDCLITGRKRCPPCSTDHLRENKSAKILNCIYVHVLVMEPILHNFGNHCWEFQSPSYDLHVCSFFLPVLNIIACVHTFQD